MKRPALDDLPLFAGDDMIGAALLGPGRAAEWRTLAPLLEGHEGFPKIDSLMGGRYVPAIRAFFDNQYGLTPAAPKRPDGVERPERWNVPARLRRA